MAVVSPTGKQAATVIGGGLVGSLWSIYLERRGFTVDVYERGTDLRAETGASGRSINLVVTSRGVDALRAVGLQELVDRLTVPVMGRMVHSIGGELASQPYGKDDTECNYSISRADLNRELIAQAAARGVRFCDGTPRGLKVSA